MSEKAEKAKEVKKPKKIFVRPVFGPMVNMITGTRIDGLTELAEIDGWTQSQIDAGKLTLED